MVEGKRKNGRGIKRASTAGKKKSAGNWFSLDSLMGKSLCILLVIILTVGAFLAPKLINNLYDAGTLMQITYTDMDLSTYVVAYTSFQEKIMAIARAKTAGDKLVALPAEEADEKVSDEELVRLVNQEMESKVGDGDVLIYEEWWWELTKENLVSREKVTAYAQPQIDAQDNTVVQEMAPIQFWILSFEVTSEQKTYQRYEYEEMVKEGKETMVETVLSGYLTDRLIVCLDAEFYKIYAMAVKGNEGVMEIFGLELPEIFALDLDNRYWMRAEADDGYMDLRMYFIEQNMADWARYWDVTPEDKRIYLNNAPGELSGCIAFWAGEAKEGDSSTGTDTEAHGASASYGMESGVVDDEMYFEEYGVYIVDSASDVVYGNRNEENKNEILLEVGLSGGFDEEDGVMWIQKSGCRDFFEMMQF